MADADGRFNRIREVAPMCPHGRIHWRHLVNTIELVLPSAHTSPQLKRQIDRFRRFCTARGRKSLYFTMGTPFPQNCTFPRISGPPSYSWFLQPDRAHSATASHSVQLFSHSWSQSLPILYNGRLFPQKLPFPTGHLDPS